MPKKDRNIVQLFERKRRRTSSGTRFQLAQKRPNRILWGVSWRPWRKVVMLLLIAIAVVGGRDVLGYLGAKFSGSSACAVTSVIDGDTVRVFCPGRGLQSARLLGFDTPELYSPRCFREWWAGTKASWALSKNLWFADEVNIVLSGTDRYNRRLATLFIDGTNLSRLMVDAGHARPYAGGKREGWC